MQLTRSTSGIPTGREEGVRQVEGAQVAVVANAHGPQCGVMGTGQFLISRVVSPPSLALEHLRSFDDEHCEPPTRLPKGPLPPPSGPPDEMGLSPQLPGLRGWGGTWSSIFATALGTKEAWLRRSPRHWRTQQTLRRPDVALEQEQQARWRDTLVRQAVALREVRQPCGISVYGLQAALIGTQVSVQSDQYLGTGSGRVRGRCLPSGGLDSRVPPATAGDHWETARGHPGRDFRSVETLDGGSRSA